LKANKIILGTVQFGLNYGINNKKGIPSKNEIFKIFNYAFDNKIRILDSAEVYGNSHSLIGEFHTENPTKVFDIITKIPKGFDGDFKKKIDNYLSELKVNSLKSIFFHSYSDIKKNNVTLKDMVYLKNLGIVESIGVSVYNDFEILDSLNYDEIDIIQMPFNLFDNSSIKNNLMNKIKEKGKIIHSRSVFLQGLFFVDIKKTKNKVALKLTKELNIIKSISKKYKISIAELAINYCNFNQKIDHILIGVDNLNHLKENLNFLNNEISSDLINQIDNIKIKDPKLLNPSLWG
tara:strand:+ start:626 stop:1498 length:873 start_codon:yes stop_codon:yes gene_type:complete